MTQPRFIAKTETAALAPQQASGRLVIDAHADLAAMLDRQGGAELAGLLAEPALGSRRDGHVQAVSWYTGFAGEPRRLSALGGAERAVAETRLGERLRALRPLFADPVIGPLASRALMIPSLDDVMVADGQPILVNWGFGPDGLDAAGEAAHFAQTLGTFAGYDAPWQQAPSEAGEPVPTHTAPITPTPSPQPVAPSGAGTVAAAGMAEGEPARDAGGSRGWAWVLALLAVFVIGLAIGWLLERDRLIAWWSGADVEQEAALAEALKDQEAINERLKVQIAETKKILEGNVCIADLPADLPALREIPSAPAAQ